MSSPRPERPSGWVLGHVAGAPVVLAPSWAVIAVVLTVLSKPLAEGWTGRTGAVAYVVAGVFVLLLFASLLVHELAHGLVARRRGQQPEAFVLTLWGGHTRFDTVAATPGSAALVAGVGPLANLLLGAVLLVLARVVAPGTLLEDVLLAGAAANAAVGVFNLAPGLPLDGGHVLAAAVWAGTGDRHRGQTVAGWAGRAVAVAIALAALAEPLVAGRSPSIATVAWAALLGAFVWSGASAAIRAARSARAVEGLTVQRVGRPAVAVGARATLAEARAAAASAGVDEVVVVAPDGRPAAYVDQDAAARVPDAVADATTVGAVASPLPVGAVVDATLVGEPLLRALAAATAHAPVVAAVVEGRVVALVRTPDVLAVLRS